MEAAIKELAEMIKKMEWESLVQGSGARYKMTKDQKEKASRTFAKLEAYKECLALLTKTA